MRRARSWRLEADIPVQNARRKTLNEKTETSDSTPKLPSAWGTRKRGNEVVMPHPSPVGRARGDRGGSVSAKRYLPQPPPTLGRVCGEAVAILPYGSVKGWAVTGNSIREGRRT